MWHAVLWNWLAFSCLAGLLVLVRYRLQRMEETVESAHAQLALQGGAR
jgi:hypothetical protein